MSFTCKEPKLRFPEFSREWVEKNFGDIYIFFNTNSFSRASLNYDCGEVKNIHYGDIHTKFQSNFYIQNEKVPFINEVEDLSKISEEVYCKEKDLVIADASEDYKDIGKTIELINLNGEKLLAGLHTYIARDTKNKMALGFSGYLMQTFKVRLQMMKFAVGISVLGISKGNLSKIRINIPSKPEQEKIASFLTAVDAKIEQLTCKEKLLEKYKKSALQKLFSKELRFKADDGSEYPEWEEKKLGEVAEIIMGQSPDSSSYNSNEIGTPLIQGNADIQNRLSNPRNWTTQLTKECKIGDLILTVRAPVGAIAKSMHNACIGRGVCAIRNNAKSNIEFLFQFLLNFESKWGSLEQGSTFTAVSGNEIKNLKINLPSLPEQTKIANFLSAIDEKLLHVKAQTLQAQQFKKALLQQMFV